MDNRSTKVIVSNNRQAVKGSNIKSNQTKKESRTSSSSSSSVSPSKTPSKVLSPTEKMRGKFNKILGSKICGYNYTCNTNSVML